ncbi:hypothetical protein Trydic_g14301 [Trypoxylus dichotomus]
MTANCRHFMGLCSPNGSTVGTTRRKTKTKKRKDCRFPLSASFEKYIREDSRIPGAVLSVFEATISPEPNVPYLRFVYIYIHIYGQYPLEYLWKDRSSVAIGNTIGFKEIYPNILLLLLEITGTPTFDIPIFASKCTVLKSKRLK